MLFKTKRHTITVEDDFRYGWREEEIIEADGQITIHQIPLTAEQALHPEEGYIMTDPRFQDLISNDVVDMLITHLLTRPGTIVARNLLIKWDNLPASKKHSPDVCVIFNVKDTSKNWGTFDVAEEGTRPVFVLEVVSESSKSADRVKKVREYALAKVEEYVYIGYHTRRGKFLWEIKGFQLIDGRYQPIKADEDGAIHCCTIQARMGIRHGQVWMEDEHGRPLLNSANNYIARLTAEEMAAKERVAREIAEAKAAALEVLLAKYGSVPKNSQ